jgi:hypothetical protein
MKPNPKHPQGKMWWYRTTIEFALEQSIVEFCVTEKDEPFISGVAGRFPVHSLEDIEKEFFENPPDFPGDAAVVYCSVSSFRDHGECWKLDVVYWKTLDEITHEQDSGGPDGPGSKS